MLTCFCADLNENCLKIANEKVPFLGEGDLPIHLRDVNNPQPGDELRSSGATFASFFFVFFFGFGDC